MDNSNIIVDNSEISIEKIGEVSKPMRGFAALSPEQRKEISSKGGKKAHEMGVAHRFTKDKARIAGQKGGLISQANARRAKLTKSDENIDKVA